MKSVLIHPLQKWSALFALLLIMAGCAKEPLDRPSECATGVAKGVPTVLSMDAPTENSGDPKGDADGNGDTISDDGDDVGDGERNRKKKPN
ncbi:MAG: hypothetical protein IPG92_03830 [Flavobacteriales bacterium]|nr:hypothetical protein [Flavobacteriales bacterium]